MSRKGPTPLKRLKEQLQAVDLLLEVRDARIPLSSRHPAVKQLFGSRPKIIVLAKADLAPSRDLSDWVKLLSGEEQTRAVALSLKQARGKESLVRLALELTAPRRESLARKGLLPRPIRACVVGLPNVGKSSLINWLTGRRPAAVGDRPGITRSNQWVRIHPSIELLDTPGILPPVKFKGETAMRLALCNILPADHYDANEAAEFGLEFLMSSEPEQVRRHFGWTGQESGSLEDVARSRSCLISGGRLDFNRAASIFLSDFREGKLAHVVMDSLPAAGADSVPERQS